ncbi:MAG: FkbM family methyltransferase [Planctomycetaceae bacterium]
MTVKMSIEEYEKLQPVASVRFGEVSVRYSVPSRMALWRAETLLTKEPETIEWIESFGPSDVLIDVGANVGMYSIWAAATRGTRVFAFEPEAQNFALLNRNIQLNGLGEKVIAWCAAVSDDLRFDRLFLNSTTIGDSCHSFGTRVDFRLQPRNFQFVQGSFSVTLDQLIESGSVPKPHHIKVDVDGFEHKVIAGARNTLADPTLRSMLIEINTNLAEHRGIISELVEHGFRFSEEQVTRTRVSDGPFAGVANYLFRRPVAAPVAAPHFGGAGLLARNEMSRD